MTTETPRSTNLHEREVLLHAGTPVKDATGALVLLHGRGANAQDILGLADHLYVPGVAFLAPQAAQYRWYPDTFLAARERNEPWLTWSLERVASIVEDLENSGIPFDSIAIGGFSQGACLTAEFAATYPRRYAALLAFTGGLIGPPGSDLVHYGSLAGTPMLLTNGDDDPHIPWQRTVETADQLLRMGADVTVKQYPRRPHTILPEEVGLARGILEKALRPGAADRGR